MHMNVTVAGFADRSDLMPNWVPPLVWLLAYCLQSQIDSHGCKNVDGLCILHTLHIPLLLNAYVYCSLLDVPSIAAVLKSLPIKSCPGRMWKLSLSVISLPMLYLDDSLLINSSDGLLSNIIKCSDESFSALVYENVINIDDTSMNENRSMCRNMSIP